MRSLLKRKPRVLLLDDDPSMQRLVAALLEREGYRVDVFLTGRDALRSLEKNDYDVLLLDLMMPHEGGMTSSASCATRSPSCWPTRWCSAPRRSRSSAP
jgi:DNA-binding response OmpR family regulator